MRGKRTIAAMRLRLLVPAMLVVVATAADACRFAQDAPPAQWFEWSSALFAAEVTGIELDRQKSADVISVRVTETFKGPDAAAAATLRVPSRMWSSCYLERPAVGAHVLVALNPNGDTLVVPLTQGYSERLRQQAGKRQPSAAAPLVANPAPPPANTAPQTGEKPFHY
jgi:hypothetical protein